MTKRLKDPTPQELQVHIQQLAAAFRVRLIEDPLLKYEEGVSLTLKENVVRGKIVGHAVVIRPVTDEASYVIALHELGHAVYEVGHNAKEFLTREHAAWEWAQYHAMVWTNAMEHVKVYGLTSYERKAEREKQQALRNKSDDAKRKAALKTFVGKLKL